jgi:hypothetical protein
MLSFDRKTRLFVDLTLSAAAKGTAGPDSSADACIASHGVESANERRGTRRVRDETEDTIMPAAASNDADTRRGAAARSGLQPQAKRKKTNDSRGKAFRVEHLRTFGLKVAQRRGRSRPWLVAFALISAGSPARAPLRLPQLARRANTRPRQL